MKPRILHISGDMPDSIQPAKSRVIESLLALTADQYDHHMWSLNRHAPGQAFLPRLVRNPLRPALPVSLHEDSLSLTAIRYDAPGRGLWHYAMLTQLADRLADHLVQTGPLPALIMGHKLTIEGIVAAEVARRIGVPFGLSIQGNTDARILKTRPDLAGRFRAIWQDAAIAFPFTPWALKAVEKALGPRLGATSLLPCPTPADAIFPPKLVGPRLVTAFHLRHQQIKNAPTLIKAAGMATRSVPGLTLDIIGDGTEEEKVRLQHLIDRDARGVVRLVGPVPHGEMQQRLNGYAGFAMPSKRESFGLVFVEALLAGCPILYPQGAAVDGYFTDSGFARAVQSNHVHAITQALVDLVRNEAELKKELRDWQAKDGPSPFRRAAIARCFSEGLAAALASRNSLKRPTTA